MKKLIILLTAASFAFGCGNTENTAHKEASPSTTKQEKTVTPINIDGEWQAIDKDGVPLGGSPTIQNNQLTFSYGSPVKITASLKAIGNNTYELNYVEAQGSQAMARIIAETSGNVDKNVTVGKLVVKSKEEIEFQWFGITLQDKTKWLEALDDEYYWGPNNTDNKITFVPANLAG